MHNTRNDHSLISKMLERDDLPFRIFTTMSQNNLKVSSSTGKNKKKRFILSSFFKTPTLVPVLYLNFSYYVAFCPFKFKFRKNGENEYEIERWLPQQILSAFVAATSILHRVAETRMSWPGPSQENPVAYFTLFHCWANLVYNFIVWYVLWFTSDKFLDLIRFLHAKEHKQDGRLRTKAIISGGMICFTATSVALLCFIFGTDLLIESQWNPQLLFRCLLRHAKFAFFISNSIGEKCSDMEVGRLSDGEIFLTCLYGASYFFRRIVGIYENMLTAVGPFTLWIATKEFIKSLDVTEIYPEGWATIVKRYNYLRKFADLINEIFGMLVVAHLFAAFFFYSVNLDKFITANDWMVRLKFLMYYAVFALTMIIGSDICREMSKMEPWIARNINENVLNDLSHRELAVVLHEIQENRISVTGCGLFTLTYSLSAQVTGVIITYFIISLQYHRFEDNVSLDGTAGSH